MLCETPVRLSEAAILIMSLSLMTACFAWFVQYTLKPGEIFGRYGLWLNYHWIHGRRRTVKKDGKKIRLRRKFWTWFLKPLGTCPYCNSVYTGTAFYIVACCLLPLPLTVALLGWPLFVGVQYAWVKVLSNYLD